MLILVRKENEQVQVHIFQDTYFESSKIHELRIMCGIEHLNYDKPLNFLFQNLTKLFLYARNQLSSLFNPFSPRKIEKKDFGDISNSANFKHQ